MGVYVALAKVSFRRQSTYRAATLAGIFTNSVFGVILASVLLAAFDQQPEINGLDASSAVTITFVTQGLLMVNGSFGWKELSDRVRLGDVTTDLQRPVDFSLYWMAIFVGSSAFAAVGRGIAPFVAGGLLFDLTLPTSPTTWISVVACVLGAGAVASRWWFLVNLTSFWLIGDIRGVVQLAVTLQMFCSGSLIPLQFFPDAMGEVLRRTPFAAMAQLPAEVFLEKLSGWTVLGAQALWVAVLHGAGLLVLRRATPRLVIDGG